MKSLSALLSLVIAYLMVSIWARFTWRGAQGDSPTWGECLKLPAIATAWAFQTYIVNPCTNPRKGGRP